MPENACGGCSSPPDRKAPASVGSDMPLRTSTCPSAALTPSSRRSRSTSEAGQSVISKRRGGTRRDYAQGETEPPAQTRRHRWDLALVAGERGRLDPCAFATHALEVDERDADQRARHGV